MAYFGYDFLSDMKIWNWKMNIKYDYLKFC